MTTTPDSPTADFARGSARILPLLLHWSLNLGGWSVAVVLGILYLIPPIGGIVSGPGVAIAYATGLLGAWLCEQPSWRTTAIWAPFALAPLYLLVAHGGHGLGGQLALVMIFAVWAAQWGGWIVIGLLRALARGNAAS